MDHEEKRKPLGIPTANIPPSGLSSYPSLSSGVYYGFIGLSLASSPDTPLCSIQVHPAVLSIGYNPFYHNTTRSVEVHVLAEFAYDFYGAALNLLILGFIRPQFDYVSREALVEDIKTDCEVARRSLAREHYRKFEDEKWLRDFEWVEKTGMDAKEAEREVLNQNQNHNQNQNQSKD
ncbi:uncharacterized protein Z518_07137 [Rhinocladiella mackenziei CBS 650.93]|uniref:Riboflavin kinase n=1 Tax=Rhinocladiella mackenziei CBS 650.93 TaxID=1442369 RepID=A0A0D2ICL4_9EURO|nr:uncharacterized protein Z518_07137 [Rhinocladiella mackenziei CBS 650.93]KIX03584.1 hypothetical protein Z518_07137 [Rhinocladiella mackenziei CBS 650.93]